MKQGKTLQELALELQRQQDVKVDYVADTRKMQFATVMNETGLDLIGAGEEGTDMIVQPFAHRQIAEHTGIPWKYYERMQQDSALHKLLDNNVMTLFHAHPKRRMVRTLDGKARAFLSDTYRRLDNFDLAEHLLPALNEIPDLRVESCELTDSRLHIKAFTPRVSGEVKVGDEVCAGVYITNSEVGNGSFRVEPLVFRLVCTNGMIIPRGLGGQALRQIHLGRRAEADEGYRILSDDTRKQADKAFFMAARDTVKYAVDQMHFHRLVQQMHDAALDEPVKDAPAAVEMLAKTEKLSEGESRSILTHLAEGGDLSRWGVLNAVTRASQDVKEYDRATELEELGGKILAYSGRDWHKIQSA